ncbi:hypothetical protein [Priestia flexa]|uniref:hypothetical protein n=1 Tax=Priestia flexa TaxID=86664 RepID=UPI000956779F|nr:hypothetical protein [Priestia flexa]MBY6087626.1 hypothetical protein [Priestia flexa]SIR40677.1 hypothetical protein SAMN05880580_12043 [Priestia flexa]
MIYRIVIVALFIFTLSALQTKTNILPLASEQENARKGTSSHQGFSINVLPDYELQKEEEGKDIIFSTHSPHTWMRIQVLEVDTANKLTSVNTATSTFEEQFGKAKMIADQHNIKKPLITAFEAYTDQEKAALYIIKAPSKAQILVIITNIKKHSPDEQELFTMINSIQLKER